MLGTYYYHQIIRKTIISFGTLFNEIYIKHKDKDGDPYNELRVPLAYGPMQKFLARIEQQPDLNKPVAITLPRISFEMTSIKYDPSRKVGVTQTFKASDGTNLKKVFMPVPYNIGFELNILTKLNDDALQIVEQILPYFQPTFTLTVDLVDSIGEKRDIPIILDSVSFKDDYEGDFSTRRSLIYTLQFTAKTYLFGPIANTTDGLIRKVQVDMYTSTDTTTAKREMRYTVIPDPIDVNPGDDFGFNENWEFFNDSKTYSPTQQTDIWWVNMANDFESIDNALNTKSIIEVEAKPLEIELIKSTSSDVQKDYEYSRAQLYSLIEKGQETLNGIMELAAETDSPRAYEVAGQILKSVADTADKLIDLQKKMRTIEDDAIKTTNNVTNNAVFVGSTSELQKLLKQGFLNNKDNS